MKKHRNKLILAAFALQILKTGFENRFLVRIFPPRPPKRHCCHKYIAAPLTVKARPARTLGIAGSEKRKSFLMVEKNTLRWEAACGSTLLGSEGGFG